MKRAVIAVITVCVLILGGIMVSNRLRASADTGQNQYRFTAVKKDLVKKTVTATGVLTAWTTVDIKSKAGGMINRLPVDNGSIVKKGDVIALIDPSDTLLTYNQAKADIDSSVAHISETDKTLALQRKQTQVAIDTAEASLLQAKAAAASAKGRYESASSTSGAQADLTNASIESARANLAAEEAKLNQMLVASHPQEEAQSASTLNQAEANLKNAKFSLDRQVALLAKGYVAQSAVDQAQATYDVARANRDAAKEKMNTIASEMDADTASQKARVAQMAAALRTAEANRVDVNLKKQAVDSALADYQSSLAQVKQAQSKLDEAKADAINNSIRQTQLVQARAQSVRSQAALTNAKIQLDQTRVTAPRDGIILKKYVEQGTLITSGVSFNSSGTSIVQLGDISRMYVDVQVDETDIASVDLDQKVDITFDAYSTTPYEGKVIKIDAQAVVDSNVTTVHVRVEVDNSVPSYRLLKPGMNATCEFVVNKKDDVVSVPNEALKTDTEGKRYVEIAEGGKPAPVDKGSEPDPTLLVGVKVVRRDVEVGLEGNDSSEITKGLKEDERVITQTIEPAAPSAGGNPFGGSKGPGRR